MTVRTLAAAFALAITMSAGAQQVVSANSHGAVISAGADDGVHKGMTGKLCAPEIVGGRIVQNCSAGFVIISVSAKESIARITKGIASDVKPGVLAEFNEKLIPPPREPRTPPRDKQRDAARAAFREANRAFNDGDFRGALERYENFIRAFPHDDNVDDARDRAAECRKKIEAIAAPPPVVVAATPPPAAAPPPPPPLPVTVLKGEQLAATAEKLMTSAQLTEARAAALEALKNDSTNPRALSILGAIRAKTVQSRFNGPSDVAAGPHGECYVADSANNTIRRIAGGAVTTFAGLAGDYGATDGHSDRARFNDPTGVALAADGTLFVCDGYNAVIRRIGADGSVSTIAGRAGLTGTADGAAASARFTAPLRIAIGSDGAVYVSDGGAHSIRRITAAGIVETLLGPGPTRIDPAGLIVDAEGSVVFADAWGHVIRKLDAKRQLSIVAGTAGTNGSADGPAASARFNAPEGIAADSHGAIYVADTGNHTVRKIADGVVSTVAGRAGVSGAIDGNGTAARLNQPSGISCDSHDRLWIADRGNHTIRLLAEGFLETVAGLAENAGSADGAN